MPKQIRLSQFNARSYFKTDLKPLIPMDICFSITIKK